MSLESIQLEKLLIELKQKHYSVYSTVIGQELFVWRLLTRTEYEIISKSCEGDNLLKEEMLCQQAVLYPTVHFGTYKAGIPSALAPQIVEESGFGGVLKTHEYLHSSRSAVFSNFTAQAEIVIASAFPQYTFEEMKGWNIEQLLDMVSRAEWKLNIIDHKEFIFQTINDDEDEEEKKTTEEVLKELEQEIISNGGDPIFALWDVYGQQVYKEYIEYPFIMGQNWDNEVAINEIQKQLSRLP